MNEGQRKIAEGLKLLVEGLLDEASEFTDATKGIEGYENCPKYFVDKAREILGLTREDYYRRLFPERDLSNLKLKYKLISEKVSRRARGE